MKWSGGPAGQRGSETGGSGTESGRGRKAQCGLYSAPSAIQRRISAISSSVNVKFDFAGGMRS
jgi:hypothetical protein